MNQPHPTPSGTHLGRALANARTIAVTTFRVIGKLDAYLNGSAILVAEITVEIVGGSSRSTSYGVELKVMIDGANSRRTLIDFDELADIIEACDFIGAAASAFPSGECDYRDVTYSTRDGATLRFRQSAGVPGVYLTVGGCGPMMSTVAHVARLRDMLISAQRGLTARGAAA